MTEFYARHTKPITLPSGKTCTVQPLAGIEWDEANDAATNPETGRRSAATYASWVCYYGIVDPKPENGTHAGRVLPLQDLYDALREIEVMSGLAAPSEGDLDTAAPEGSEADPLVDEFPAAAAGTAGVAPSADVVGTAGAGEGVRVLEPGSDAAGGSGDVPDDDCGRDSASQDGEAA